MTAIKMPKRSSDLHVLDDRIWANVNQRMRKEECSWPHAHREMRAEYKARLKRTAPATPRSFTRKAVQDMAHRCKFLVDAKGYYFKE